MNEISPSEKTVLDIDSAVCYSVSNVESSGFGREADTLTSQHDRTSTLPRSQNADGVFMRPDNVDMHWLWRETTNRLARFLKAVRENKQVMEAADFCRWLRFSGLVSLFREFPQDAPFPVDWQVIDKQITDILFECGEKFRTGKADPQYAETDIAEINHKLDLIAAHVATLSPSAQGNSLATTPAIRVLQADGFDLPPLTATPDLAVEAELRAMQGGC